jgi:hypothetical protein
LQATAPQPILFWHWVIITFTTGTNGIKIYIDGTQIAQGTPVTPTAAINTDRLLIRCDEPMALAHVCFWGTVLTQAQIQTVSGQIAPWPPNVPINTEPTPSGGGGGLTTDQAASLTNIENHTNDIPGIDAAVSFISDTVNHIKGVTDQVLTNTQQLLANLTAGVDALGGLIQQTIQNTIGAVTTTAGDIAATIGQLLSQQQRNTFGLYNVTSGPTCAPIDHVTSTTTVYYAATVNITTRPAVYVGTTPDQNWTYPDLAVLRVFVDGEMIFRYGIHSDSYELSPLPDSTIIGVSRLGVPILPPGYRLRVDWAEGVCGELILQYIP